jgi:hypothetical protein
LHQCDAVLLKYDFFRIGGRTIIRDKVLVILHGVLQSPVFMQPGIASITDNFHDPCTRIAAAESGKEPESA